MPKRDYLTRNGPVHEGRGPGSADGPADKYDVIVPASGTGGKLIARAMAQE